MSRKKDAITHRTDVWIGNDRNNTISELTTHTLRRWKRYAMKMGETGYAVKYGELVQDILKVLEGLK